MALEPESLEAMVSEYVRTASPNFRPYAHYSRASDALFIHTENVPTFHRRLGSHLTLLVAMGDKRVVGCVVKGIRALARDLPKAGRVTVKVVYEGFVAANIRTKPEMVWVLSEATANVEKVKEQELELWRLRSSR